MKFQLITGIMSLILLNALRINLDKKNNTESVSNSIDSGNNDSNYKIADNKNYIVQADDVENLNITKIKLMKMNSTSVQDNMINPKIEIFPKVDLMSKFHPVNYVKEISDAGKAALELTNSGEYI